MRVLVTGAAGFIGSAVAAALAGAGHDVTGIDCLHPKAHPAAATVPPGVALADVRDPDAVADALAGVDVVAHHAAMVGMGVDLSDLPDYVGANDLATAVLLAQMSRAGVGRLVLASSMVVYGDGAYTCAEHGTVTAGPRRHEDLVAGRFEPHCPRCHRPLAPAQLTEDRPFDPRSVYAATKVAQEQLTQVWVQAGAGAAIALRYHNVYGPGMPRHTPYSGVAAIFRSRLERGQPPLVNEDGAQRRDFIHVSDVAAANVAAVARLAGTAPGRFDAFNIASGTVRTVGELASALAAAMDGPAPVITGAHRAGDVRHITASPRLAGSGLGFVAKVDFATGIAQLATAQLRG